MKLRVQGPGATKPVQEASARVTAWLAYPFKRHQSSGRTAAITSRSMWMKSKNVSRMHFKTVVPVQVSASILGEGLSKLWSLSGCFGEGELPRSGREHIAPGCCRAMVTLAVHHVGQEGSSDPGA